MLQFNTNQPLAALTAYDYPTGRLADEAGLDFILVGDSLGMVALGFDDTTWVTMDHMLHHVAAVRRAVRHTPLVADLPYQSYQSPAEALTNARRLLNAGAQAVKLEGGAEVLPQVTRLSANEIDVIGHLGMLPQQVRAEGGYSKKGKKSVEAERLITEARLLEDSGVRAIVLESIVPETAARITESLSIPTVGIGCGEGTCKGEIAVVTDILGTFPWFVPPFAKPEAQLAPQITDALKAYVDRVRS